MWYQVIRELGSLPSNDTCRVYALGPQYPVRILEPSLCNPNLPQAYCSFDTVVLGGNLCGVIGAMEVRCNSSTVDGLMIDGNCQFDGEGRSYLQFISLGSYREWIAKTSGAETNTKFSIMLMVSLVFFTLKAFCFNDFAF